MHSSSTRGSDRDVWVEEMEERQGTKGPGGSGGEGWAAPAGIRCLHPPPPPANPFSELLKLPPNPLGAEELNLP